MLNFGHLGLSVSTNSSSRIIRFSSFEVNLHTGELRQRGQRIKLQQQPLQVLAALLERPGEMSVTAIFVNGVGMIEVSPPETDA